MDRSKAKRIWIGATIVTDNKFPKFLDVEQVSSGWINKYILKFRLPDGRDYQYEAVSRKPLDVYKAELETQGPVDPQVDAVCIVGYTAEGSFLLIKEFRFPMNRECIAFPAGLRDAGESVEECASRELREETGYDLARNADGTPVHIHSFVQPGFSSLGMGDESIAMVFAQVEKVGEPRSESTEFIEVFELPRADIARFLQENRAPLSIRAQLVLEMVACDPFA
ncbi:NUDIX hydrolase [Slackia equolifaciens]|uniref:NUDIX hydrolase n=1 Tax=Slackia equolifaciens TaxID=498718 RepID=A0A3N0B2P3_9ACTN|nr:NUDIX hydrolase [Slackia equolifaciens]